MAPPDPPPAPPNGHSTPEPFAPIADPTSRVMLCDEAKTIAPPPPPPNGDCPTKVHWEPPLPPDPPIMGTRDKGPIQRPCLVPSACGPAPGPKPGRFGPCPPFKFGAPP